MKIQQEPAQQAGCGTHWEGRNKVSQERRKRDDISKVQPTREIIPRGHSSKPVLFVDVGFEKELEAALWEGETGDNKSGCCVRRAQ